MSALLKRRAKERAAALEKRKRGDDGSGDEGGEEVEELAVYKVVFRTGRVLRRCWALIGWWRFVWKKGSPGGGGRSCRSKPQSARGLTET